MVCDPKLTDDYINRILVYLQGWIVLKDFEKENQTIDTYASSFLEREHMDEALTTVKTISREELDLFYAKGKEEVKSWIWFSYIPRIPMVHEAMLKWTAGLIWKKYNVKENELLDATNAYGYGDQLISQAKKMLRPYIRTRLRRLN